MRRRKSSYWKQFRRQVVEMRGSITRQPFSAGAVGFAALILSWLVLVKSLPYSLAETAPEAALALNSNHPAALLTMATRARTRLLELSRVKINTETVTEASIGELESVAIQPTDGDAAARADERNALREQIRSLAKRIIANDPLNASAFRLLAEVTDDPAQVRILMQEAVKRSRRESIAVFWLLNDAFENKDFAAVIEKADILLRTRPDFTRYVTSYLGELAATPEGRAPLVSLLAQNPPWRGAFFNTLPRSVRLAETPLELMLALKEAGSPPSAKELAPYFTFLVSANFVGPAYDAWLQFIPQEKLASLGLLNNPAFADDPSGLPFDWLVARGMNAIVEFVPISDKDRARAIRFSFGVGRVKFPQASQVVMLAPARYRLAGEFQGSMVAKRGLRWQFRCTGRKNGAFAETELIYGHPRSWQPFSLDLDVPDGDDCRAQQLRLFHDARSASEEMISGEISFRGLSLIRLEK